MYYGHEKAGSIHGVPCTEFPIELLSKMNLGKIIECATFDDRLPAIVANRIPSMSIEDISCVKDIKDEVVAKHPEIKVAYNNYIHKNRDKIDSAYRYRYRRDHIRWEWLDEGNKKAEAERWLNNKSSGIRENELDFTFLLNNFPDLTIAKMDKLMQRVEDKYYNCNSVAYQRMVATMPKETINKYFPRIMKLRPTERMHILSNPLTPVEYYDSALRSVPKNGSSPNINIDLNLDHLKALPPITRLNVLETLVNNHSLSDEFVKNCSEEDFSELFFTSMIRYPDRVERVVSKFKKKKERIADQSVAS